MGKPERCNPNPKVGKGGGGGGTEIREAEETANKLSGRYGAEVGGGRGLLHHARREAHFRIRHSGKKEQNGKDGSKLGFMAIDTISLDIEGRTSPRVTGEGALHPPEPSALYWSTPVLVQVPAVRVPHVWRQGLFAGDNTRPQCLFSIIQHM